MIDVVLGRRGCGKTTWIKERIQVLSRVLVFDTLGEYDTGIDGGPLTVSYDDVPSFVDALQANEHGLFRLSLRPMRGDLLTAFNLFLRAAWVVGDLTVVVDEIDAVSAPTSIPEELSRFLRYGRHRGLSLIAASRRAAEVPRLLTSQADRIVSFNQSEPSDLKYIRDYVGADFAARVSRLPRFEYREFTPWGTGNDDGKLQFPEE